MSEYRLFLSFNEDTSNGCLLVSEQLLKDLLVFAPKLHSNIVNLYYYDVVPFRFRSIYETYFKMNKIAYIWLNSGVYIKGFADDLKVLDCIIYLRSTPNYIPNGKHIGMEFTNKRTRDYIMMNQRYYYVDRIDYMDVARPGLTLPEKIKWIRLKFRKRYVMLIAHLMIEHELPNFKEFLCSYINSIELFTGLEIGFRELYLMSLLPQQIFAELANIPSTNVSTAFLIIADSLGINPNILKTHLKRPNQIKSYCDLLSFGTTLSKHFDSAMDYILLCIQDINIGWRNFPYIYIDCVSGTYRANNGYNRNKEDIEKLIIWKTLGFNTKYLNWINNSIILNDPFDRNIFSWYPPLAIYNESFIEPDGNTVELVDHGTFYTITTKEGYTNSYKI